MEQYKINYHRKEVQVSHDGEFDYWCYLTFDYLETNTPLYLHLNIDRANVYAIARDFLIEQGIINPIIQEKERTSGAIQNRL